MPILCEKCYLSKSAQKNNDQQQTHYIMRFAISIGILCNSSFISYDQTNATDGFNNEKRKVKSAALSLKNGNSKVKINY
jgi:hypothetical protein